MSATWENRKQTDMSTLIVIVIALVLYFGLLAFVVALCKMAARGDTAQQQLYAAWTRERSDNSAAIRLDPLAGGELAVRLQREPSYRRRVNRPH